MSIPRANTDAPPLKVLIVDDSAANRELLRCTLEPEGFDAFLVPSGEVALDVARRVRPTLVLMDVRMPGGMDGFETCRRMKADPATADIPVLFITVDDDEETLLEAFRAGGVDHIRKPFKEREVVARVRTHAYLHDLADRLRRKNAELEAEIARRVRAEVERDRADQQLDLISQQELAKWGLSGFVGSSPAMTALVEDLRRLQRTTTTTILILGESGTGKELIARAIHFGGARAKGPFIAMNCSAIPAELAESTLFGHVQGAFTGARGSLKGSFESADGGTLFLDEIGDMPLLLQSKLLRVLEDGIITPVGSTQPRKVSVRVIAATHRQLSREIQLGRFRQDLYFRLSSFIVASPALRERKGDIRLLVDHFIQKMAPEMGLPDPGIAEEALRILENYEYPGNVRELRNIVEHALIRSGGMIEARDLPALEPPGIRPPATIPSPVPAQEPDLPRRPEERRDESADKAQVAGFLARFGTLSNAECCELLGLSGEKSYALLNKFVKQGFLTRTGERRWTRYQLAKGDAPSISEGV